MNKKWYERLDYKSLCSMLCFWAASWLFMMPMQIQVARPYYDNVWGAFFALFGAVNQETANVQQLPDLLSGLIAFLIMFFLHIRGLYSVTKPSDIEKDAGPFEVILNILSILVRSLFFTVIIKAFLFPETGNSTGVLLERMKTDFGCTVFVVFCVTGMLFGVRSLSKILFIILVFTGIFRNIKIVSSIMGITGYVALLFSVTGFYFDFSSGLMNLNSILSDLKIMMGKYKALENDATEESVKLYEKSKRKRLLKK